MLNASAGSGMEAVTGLHLEMEPWPLWDGGGHNGRRYYAVTAGPGAAAPD